MRFPPPFAAAVLLGLLSVSSALAAQAIVRPDTTGTIIGSVVIKDSNVPLGYANVGLPDLHAELLADATGRFSFSNVPAGSITIRVKHIGYIPADTTVAVLAGQTTVVHLALSRLVVELDPVRVVEHPPCTAPGRPGPNATPELLTVFGQLMQNADQSRLLIAQYPYRAITARTISTQTKSGVALDVKSDTIVRRSGSSWIYAPGRILTPMPKTGAARIFGGAKGYDVSDPGLTDIAQEGFIANHCFWYGGEETIDGQRLIRLDFGAAVTITEPDIAGAFYLDPKSYVIRRSVTHLTRIPADFGSVAGFTTTSIFSELFPGVPVVNQLESVTQARYVATSSGIISSTEFQSVVSVQFLKGRP